MKIKNTLILTTLFSITAVTTPLQSAQKRTASQAEYEANHNKTLILENFCSITIRKQINDRFKIIIKLDEALAEKAHLSHKQSIFDTAIKMCDQKIMFQYFKVNISRLTGLPVKTLLLSLPDSSDTQLHTFMSQHFDPIKAEAYVPLKDKKKEEIAIKELAKNLSTPITLTPFQQLHAAVLQAETKAKGEADRLRGKEAALENSLQCNGFIMKANGYNQETEKVTLVLKKNAPQNTEFFMSTNAFVDNKTLATNIGLRLYYVSNGSIPVNTFKGCEHLIKSFIDERLCMLQSKKSQLNPKKEILQLPFFTNYCSINVGPCIPLREKYS
jgi:hypothetical protein